SADRHPAGHPDGHHLVAAGRASAGHPVARPAAARLAVAGRASGWDFDFDSSFCPFQRWFEALLNQFAPRGRKTMHEPPSCSVRFPCDQKIESGPPTAPDVFLPATGDSTTGRYMLLWLLGVPIRAHLVVRWLALAGPRDWS